LFRQEQRRIVPSYLMNPDALSVECHHRGQVMTSNGEVEGPPRSARSTVHGPLQQLLGGIAGTVMTTPELIADTLLG